MHQIVFFALLLFAGCQSSEPPKNLNYRVLYDFQNEPSGWQPWGSLTLLDPWLYGCTRLGGESGQGTVFRLQKDGTQFTVLHSFGESEEDGVNPHHDLLRQSGPWLFGATLKGGKYGEGTLFRINQLDGSYELLHHFQKDVDNGAFPHSNPMPVDSLLIGLTESGGEHNGGVLYQIDQNGGHFTLLHSFAHEKGNAPHGFVINHQKALWGMTRHGGAQDLGVIFRFDLDSKEYAVVHTFNGHEGATPFHGGLTLVDKALYGLTTKGGSRNQGVLFRFQPETQKYTILHNFEAGLSNGSFPRGSLTVGGEFLYGMSYGGGARDLGGIFRFHLPTATFEWIHSFEGAQRDGSHGEDIVTISGRTLYGMTQKGGQTLSSPTQDPAYSNGVIFRQRVSSTLFASSP